MWWTVNIFFSILQKECNASKRDTVVLLLQDMLEVVTRDMMLNEIRLVNSLTKALQWLICDAFHREVLIFLLLCLTHSSLVSWLSLVMVIRILFLEDNSLLVQVQSLPCSFLHQWQHNGKNRCIAINVMKCIPPHSWPNKLMLLRLLLQIKRLYLLLTVKESAVDVPTNLEARRRIAFFTNSLFMDMPRAPRVRKMLSFRFRALLSRSYCCKTENH